MCQDGCSFTWHQPCNNPVALSVRYFGGYSKMCYKRLQSLIQNHMWQERTETAQEHRLLHIKEINNNNQQTPDKPATLKRVKKPGILTDGLSSFQLCVCLCTEKLTHTSVAFPVTVVWNEERWFVCFQNKYTDFFLQLLVLPLLNFTCSNQFWWHWYVFLSFFFFLLEVAEKSENRVMYFTFLMMSVH